MGANFVDICSATLVKPAQSKGLILTDLEVVSGLAPPAVLARRVEAVQRAGVDVLARVIDDHGQDDDAADVGDLKMDQEANELPS